MFKKIIAYLLLISALLVGLLSLYRVSLKSSDMTIVNGKVTEKEISYYTSYRRFWQKVLLIYFVIQSTFYVFEFSNNF